MLKLSLQKRNLFWLFLTLAVIVLDQISKAIISHGFSLYESYPLLPWFGFTLLHNQGAAFSFLNGAGPLATWVLGLLAVVVSIGLIIWMLRTPPTKSWLLAALALILGGALGNVVDRIHQGYVVDFLLFHYNTWYFPAFNFADSAITAGAMMLVIDMLFFNREERAHERS